MELAWIEADAGYPDLTIDYLESTGIAVQHLEVEADAFQPALDTLKQERGYVEQDIVELAPETENLDAICAKFADEHLHEDDEVRFVLDGAGVFDIRDAADRWMRVTVERGDLIVVPKDRYHRFYLTETKQIRCVRLFKDRSGWVPHYR